MKWLEMPAEITEKELPKRSLEMDRKKRWEKLKDRKMTRIAMILLSLCLLLAGGRYVYAKYLSQSARRGVALASSIYFTSNHAASSQTDAGGSDLYDMTDAFVSVAESVDDRNYNFQVEIRNYENILLFNSSNAEIPYRVELWLAGDPKEGDQYTVTYTEKHRNGGELVTEEQQTKNLSKTEKVSIDNILPGGQALSDDYTIKVTLSDENPVPIYVVAKTKEGALLSETLKGKIMLQKSADTGDFLKTFGFTIPSGSEEDAFLTLQKQSEFSYKITTGGINGETGDDTDVVTMYWDPEVYDIDRFSNAYLAWEKKGNTAPAVISKSSLQQSFGTNDGFWEGWSDTVHGITIQINAYASVNTGFFRGEKYNEKVTSTDSQQKYVYVVKGDRISP